mmetsp:Transcript_36930/g.86939  ORF Transcript_36930/g.86939 Transcript_36930/m.86939 type:complete len:209 (-) Transcript_36930:207-833(-)
MEALSRTRSPSAASMDVVKNSRPPMSAHPASSTPFLPPSLTAAFHFFASTPAGGPSSFFTGAAAGFAASAAGAGAGAGFAGSAAGVGAGAGAAAAGLGSGAFLAAGGAAGLGVASLMNCWRATRGLGGMAVARRWSASARMPSALCFVRYAFALSASAFDGLFFFPELERSPEFWMAVHRPPLKSSGLSAATALTAMLTTFLTSLILK